MRRLLLLSICLILTASQLSQAQTPRDVSVELEASIAGNKYTITWPNDARATAYQINRRIAGVASWGSAITLGGTATSYTDSTMVAGKLYEFRVTKTLTVSSSITARGYIYGGIAIDHPIAQGTVILVIDDTVATPLSAEIFRLEEDLMNEGWQVRKILVKRSWNPARVKDSIMKVYGDPAAKASAVFLLGHVPVPYSGMIVPDGHINNHLMPWPADGYYADDAEWYDDVDYDTSFVYQSSPGVFDTMVIPPVNRNFAGDGRFDHSTFPDPVDLMIGRVDLANMPAFAPKSEVDLLRAYLDRDHAYRTGQLTAPARALIDDNFGLFSVNEAFASSAWRAFPQLVGRDSIKVNPDVDWFATLPDNPYLWAYGCGGGNFTGAGGIGSTTDFATKGSKAIFTMLFGSYFGDWNVTNNFLRAPLASEYGLSCAWSGRPYWYFQPMAIGQPIGFCARLTQNNGSSYATGPSPTSIHIALMGDPTLKMHAIVPPEHLIATNEGFERVRLTWNASSDPSIEGYNIYKAHEPQGQYYLSNATPIQLTEYLDTIPFSGKNVYMVHAVRTEVTPAGSYLNRSPAARTTIDGVQSVVASTKLPIASLSARETPTGTDLILSIDQPAPVRIMLYNTLGALVKVFDERTLTSGSYTYHWSAMDKGRVARGVYIAVAEVSGVMYRVKVLNVE